MHCLWLFAVAMPPRSICGSLWPDFFMRKIVQEPSRLADNVNNGAMVVNCVDAKVNESQIKHFPDSAACALYFHGIRRNPQYRTSAR